MLYSTKIKFIGIVGTFSIISLSYILHAKTFYADLSTSNDLDFKSKQEVVKFADSSDENKTVASKDLSMPKRLEKSYYKISEQNNSQTKSVATKDKNLIFIELINVALSENRYLYIDKTGQITQESKKVIDEISPMLLNVKDCYIEIEGYSALKKSEILAQKASKKYAQVVASYLKTIATKSEIRVTGYGSRYPIIEDIKDARNSRVELKLRRR